MHRSFCAAAGILLALAACKKEEIRVAMPPEPVTTDLAPGVPPKADSIHGYFFCGFNFIRVMENGGGNTSSVEMSLYAQFVDPAGKLGNYIDRRNDKTVLMTRAGNVGMGNVTYNNFSLYMNSTFVPDEVCYTSQTGFPALMDFRVKWNAEGNDFIHPFEQVISNGYPAFTDTIYTPAMQTSKGFTVNLHDYFDSWDSVVVQIRNTPYYYTGHLASRSAGSEATHIIFTAKETDYFLNDSDASLIVRGFRYFNRTIQGRRYLFECSVGVQNRLYISR